MRDCRARSAAVDRTDVDDGATAARHHAAAHRLDHDVSAGKIAVDLPSPVLEPAVLETADGGVAGIVHQDRRRPRRGDCRLERGGHRCGISDIGDHGVKAMCRAAGQRLQRRGVAVACDHGGAEFGEQCAERAADSSAGTGDQRCLAREPDHGLASVAKARTVAAADLIQSRLCGLSMPKLEEKRGPPAPPAC